MLSDRRKGVVLKDEEINLLFMIYKHRMVTVDQIAYWLGLKGGSQLNSLRRRLTKFSSYKLLARQKYPLLEGVYYYYYRIGPQGIQVLIDNDYIKSEVDSDYKYILKTAQSINIDHQLATQQVVIQVMKNMEALDIISSHPFDSLFLREEKDDKPFLVPDWLLRYGDRNVYVELDTGTESMTNIENKIERYKDWATINPSEQHYVFFISLDDSFKSSRHYGDKRRRVGNIKFKASELLLEGSMQNFDVFSVPLTRASANIERILTREAPYTRQEKQERLKTGIDVLVDMNDSFPYTFNLLNTDDYFFQEDMNYSAADAVFEVKEGGAQIEKVGMVLLEEGSVSSLMKLDRVYSNIEEQKTKQVLDRLIGIYETAIETEYDVLGIKLKNLLLADHETWDIDYESPPKFYKQLSSISLEETYYHE
jgi:predicted transcriptional regulator